MHEIQRAYRALQAAKSAVEVSSPMWPLLCEASKITMKAWELSSQPHPRQAHYIVRVTHTQGFMWTILRTSISYSELCLLLREFKERHPGGFFSVEQINLLDNRVHG